MFGVIASSTTRLSPNNKAHYHHHHSSPLQSELEHNCEVSNAKNIQDKERETFLSYGIFNMVAGKRTAELLHKQHKHDHQPHRLSNPDICGLGDLCSGPQHKQHESESSDSHSKQRRHKQSKSVDILHLIGASHFDDVNKDSESEAKHDSHHDKHQDKHHDKHHDKYHTHESKEHVHKTKRVFHKTKK